MDLQEKQGKDSVSCGSFCYFVCSVDSTMHTQGLGDTNNSIHIHRMSKICSMENFSRSSFGWSGSASQSTMLMPVVSETTCVVPIFPSVSLVEGLTDNNTDCEYHSPIIPLSCSTRLSADQTSSPPIKPVKSSGHMHLRHAHSLWCVFIDH